MSDPEHPGHSSANGAGDAKQLLEFLRRSQDVLLIPAGAVLFQEGEPCHGAYLVEEGELHLMLTSGAKRLKVGLAKPGHLLAISSVVGECDYQCTAEAATECKVIFVKADELRKYLGQNAAACLFAVEKLGAELLEITDTVVRPLRLQPRYPRPQ